MSALEDLGDALAAAPQPPAQAPVAQGDAIPREDFAWLVVQEACETDPADEDDPECIRILRRDLKSAVLAAFLRYDAENHGIAWGAYQAGHADAKAETAAPVVGRWYFVTNDGAATLCVDEADARESAAEADIAFPRMAPHRAVQLVPADQLAAAVVAARERAATVVDEKIGAVRKANPGSDGGINSAVGFVLYALGSCADAIRAGANGVNID